MVFSILGGSEPRSVANRGLRSRQSTGAGLTSLAGLLRYLLFALIAALWLIPSGAAAQGATTQETASQSLRPVFSPDGAKLARADRDGLITVLDLESGRELATIREPLGAVTALAFSPDGQVLASARENTIAVWGAADGTEITVLQADPGRTISRLAFSPSGDLVAAVVDGTEIGVWDLRAGAISLALSRPSETVTEIAFSSDGRFLAGFGSSPGISVWDLDARELYLTLTSPTGAPITGMAFNPADGTLAAADEDANIALWDVDSGDRTGLMAHADLIKRFRFSPDGAMLASEGTDAWLMVWDAHSGLLQDALPARFDTLLTGLAFSPDGTHLASVGERNEILVWGVSSGALTQVLAGHGGVVAELAFGSSGQTLASVDSDGQIIVWDLGTGSERFSLQISGPETASDEVPASVRQSAASSSAARTSGITTGADTSKTDLQASTTTAASTSVSKAITSLAVAADGAEFASASEDSSVRLWSETGELLTMLEGHPGAVASSVVFSPNGKELYSVGRDTQVRRWKRSTGALMQVLLAHEHPIRAVAQSGDGNYVASAGEETRLMVWDAKKGKLAHILSGHRDFVNALAFKPNGLELASAGADGRILRWNVKNGTPVDALLGHAAAVNALAYSGNGLMLASGSSDTTVKLWDTKTGRELQSLGHPSPIESVAISTNKKYLASAGQDTRIYIWDIAIGGKLISVLNGGTRFINALAYLPNGYLLAGSEDGSITIWDVENSQILRVITPTPLAQTDSLQKTPGALPTDGDGLGHTGVGGIAEVNTGRSSDDLLLGLVGRVLEWLVPAASAQALPDPTQGPGGPILVIDSASSLFGKYYAEILRTEGFNAFSVADISSVTAQALAAYDVVILAEMPLFSAQATMLSDWVNTGGNLIAMRPDPQLAGLLGLTATGATLSEGYVLVDTSASPGNGIVAETIQFHGTADRYALNDATAVAMLYAGAATATSNPAVTLRNVGTNGGQAAAFTYDLATSIVYTRQGNPTWANQERDGFAPQRSDDKYYGAATGDPQVDWVDLDKVAIPQADEQQRLLANLILHMTRDQMPLPRFWYFPRGEKAVVIMTGDDHANNGTAGRWDQFLAASPPGCSVEDWECVRGTSYMYDNTPLSDAQAAAYEAQGFEVGLHINTNCADFTEAQLDTYYAQQIAAFSAQWPSAPAPTTQRHHCIAWTDWVTAAKVQIDHGVRLDTSYYFWPPSWVLNRPGNFTGSAMPMRFADLDGTLIDVYQAASQMTDESGQTYPFSIDTLLDRALGAEGYYGAYTINAHTDVAQIPESDAVVASALARDVPIITSRQMLEWLDGRNGSSFGSISWDDGTATLTFTVTAGTGANGLQALVPLYTDAGVVNGVTRDGVSIPYTSATRAGVDYAIVAATDGAYAVTYGVDATPPTVVSVSPAAGAVDVSQGSFVSATFSEPMAAATLNGATFALRDAANVLVDAAIAYNAETRTAALTPASSLDAGTTYTATIAGGGPTDLAGNPIASAVVWAFTTEAAPSCPCTVWDGSETPATPSAADPNAVELGVKFRSDVDGFITGVRFYKGALNTGTHVGNLWAADGTPLATAIFTNETASGWQHVDFPTPVPITANSVYVASYHAPNGGYAVNAPYFAGVGVDNAPLHFLADGESGGNGVYLYGPGGFPNQSYNAGNYWVDVVFSDIDPLSGPDTTPPEVTATTPSDSATRVSVSTEVTVTFSEAMDPGTITGSIFRLADASNTSVPATVTYDAATRRATLTPSSPLEALTTYTADLTAEPTDLAGNPLTAGLSWSFTTAEESACPCTIWPSTAVPTVAADPDTGSVELGVKFTADVDGFITGIRFYKFTTNTGTHVGNLWTNTGTLLATATFANETASGWQQVDFGSPVPITAGSVYVASYLAPNGRYASDTGYFAGTGVDNPPLHALQDGASGANGVYIYGNGGEFPSFTWQASNYWVDVVFATSVGPDTTPPTITGTSPSDGALDVGLSTVVTATFSEPMDPTTISGATIELRDGGGASVPAAVTYDAAARTASLAPTAALLLSAQYSATVKGAAAGVKDLAGNALASDVTWTFTTVASDPCATPANAVVAENCLAGNPKSEWEVSGAGDPSIQGFATDISVDRGEVVDFKIDTDATDYRLDIYRMGFYGGDGARQVTTILPSATLPQTQPSCLNDAATGLIDCGNWAVSASWSVPADATSGIYFAKAVREDTGGASHIVFIVRDDAGTADILFQTSDTTWQAYNTWGGNSLYTGSGPGTGGSADGRAYKVSYNRPFNTRSVDGGQDWLFNAEYPMVRWLEANGYDVSYFTGIDSDRFGSLILNHKVFLSVGHDEYWSGQQRANVEAARDAGVHLAFFSGNEMFWKTRWEGSIDGSNTDYRTLVCYKETHDFPNNRDPEDPPIWTGTWRDPRNSPPADGGRPENDLTGTIFTVNAGATTSIAVPAEDGRMRFWRNTSIAGLAPGDTATLPFGTLGYEWDEDLDNGFRPAGLLRLSTTTVEGAPVLTDYGSTFASGTATHHLTLYKHSSGALVFGSGTVQWSWGLDADHDRPGTPADPRMQQATVNLLADMDTQPGTLVTGLTPATASTDVARPVSAISTPASGSTVAPGSSVTITGTATDTGGQVGGVEISVDGGATWHPASGRSTWNYEWVAPSTDAVVNISSRAVDDSGNLEGAVSGITVIVGSGGSSPTLSSIAVTPTNPAIQAGGNQQFSATGTYSDSTTQNLTNQVTWTSSQTGVATISATGVATGLSPGTSMITASLESVSGNTELTVLPAPLSITTTSLPNGTVDAVYSATVEAAGGTGPYTWSIVNGTLPVGLTLDSATGAINGVPTTAVNSSFTVQVMDSATPAAASTNALDITIFPSTVTIWPDTAVPGLIDGGPDRSVELGVKFRSDVAGAVTGIRFYKAAANTGTHVANLWSSTGTLLATATYTNETASGWQQVNFANPVPITANTVYIASYHAPNGHYSADVNFFRTGGVDNPPLHALVDGESGGNGVYAYGASSSFPNKTWRSANYWVDIVFRP